MDIIVLEKFQIDGSKWEPEHDAAPHGFRSGNTYNVPDAVAHWAIELGIAHEPGKEPKQRTRSDGPVELQPDDAVIDVTSSSP